MLRTTATVIMVTIARIHKIISMTYIFEMSAEQLIKDFSAKIAFEQDLEDGVTYYGHTKSGGRSRLRFFVRLFIRLLVWFFIRLLHRRLLIARA